MDSQKTYFAFISYQRQDEDWARWITHELENYKLPVTLINRRTDLPKELRPVFRDADELSAGNLPRQIYEALENSQNLVVVCSPHAANSKWVNKEIEYFINMGKTNRIFPFIIDGIPFSPSPEEECFPPALLNLPKDEERLGGNVNEKGRDAAIVKIVSGMLNLRFDSLWQRYEREKAEEERKIRERRDQLLRLQSRFLAKEAKELIFAHQYDIASLLALEALPENLASPDRPFVKEAEEILREASFDKSPIVRFSEPTYFDEEGTLAVTAEKGYLLRIWNPQTNEDIKKLHLANLAPNGRDCYQLHNDRFDKVIFTPCPDDSNIIVLCQNYAHVVDYKLGQCRQSYSVNSGYRFKDIVFSPNRRYICCIAACDVPGIDKGYVERNLMYIYDTETASVINETNCMYHDRVCIAFSPDSQLVASVCGHEIFIHNLRDYSLLYKWKSFNVGGECCFLSNSNLLFSIKDNSLVKWSFESDPYEVESIYSGKEAVTGIICDDNLISLATSSDSIIIIDAELKYRVAERHWHSEIRMLSFSKDKKRVIFTDSDSLRSWNYHIFSADQHLLYLHPGLITCAEINPDATHIISASYGCIKIWDIQTQKIVKTIDIDFHPFHIGIAANDNIYIQNTEGDIYVYNSQSDSISKLAPKVVHMKVGEDGKDLLLADEISVMLFDAVTGEKYQVIDLPEGNVLWQVAISPDSKHFAITECLNCGDTDVSVWDTETGSKKYSLLLEGPQADSISFSQDGKSVLIDECQKWDYEIDILKEIKTSKHAMDTAASFAGRKIVIDGCRLLMKTDRSLQSLIDETRYRLKHHRLSAEERQRYYLE